MHSASKATLLYLNRANTGEKNDVTFISAEGIFPTQIYLFLIKIQRDSSSNEGVDMGNVLAHVTLGCVYLTQCFRENCYSAELAISDNE